MAIVFTPGLCLSERYRLERPVGSGGMSQIWLARDEVLGRAVAVKTLNGARLADPALLEAVHREARAAANISHPHVTQVYDFGETEITATGADDQGAGDTDGERTVPFLVMELLEGEDLAQRLATGPLEWRAAVRLAAEVAGALEAAHALGIVHGDIKPSNVMLTPSGSKVIDFGIASWDDEPDESGPRGGTPAYLAPEVLAGEPATTAADVYALGALLYATLTGHTPIAAATWDDAAQAHADGARPAPLAVAGLPAVVADVCLRCLDPAPDARPSASEAMGILRRSVRSPLAARIPATAGRAMAVGTAAVRVPTLGLPPERPEFPDHRSRWWAPVVLATAAMVAGFVLIAVAAFGSGGSIAPVRPVVAPAEPAAPANQGAAPTDSTNHAASDDQAADTGGPGSGGGNGDDAKENGNSGRGNSGDGEAHGRRSVSERPAKFGRSGLGRSAILDPRSVIGRYLASVQDVPLRMKRAGASFAVVSPFALVPVSVN